MLVLFRIFFCGRFSVLSVTIFRSEQHAQKAYMPLRRRGKKTITRKSNRRIFKSVTSFVLFVVLHEVQFPLSSHPSERMKGKAS